MAEQTGVITPEVREWEFTAKSGPAKGEARIFYQSELTIDGEFALLGLVTRAMATLAENDFPIADLGKLQAPDGQLDWEVAGRLASEAAPYVPSLASESSAILFGYFPTDHQNHRSPDYDEVVKFIRSGLTTTRWIDVLNVFSDQNDWKRMSAPFAGALRKGVALGLWAEKQQESPLPVT